VNESHLRYTTDELENAIDYLEQAAEFYRDKENKHLFKWLMLTLHGALYTFGVCALKSTTEIVLKDSKINKRRLEELKNELIKFYKFLDDELAEASIKHTLMELISINVVIERCTQEKYMLQNTKSKLLELDEKQIQAIGRLISYRNDFVHFKPCLYGITGDYDSDIIKPICKIIGFLALESNNILYFGDKNEERVKIALDILNRTRESKYDDIPELNQNNT
jgi:hypothetical protein